MKDEILDEVWKNRDTIAKECDYDLEKIVAMIQSRETMPLNNMVAPAKRRIPLDK